MADGVNWMYEGPGGALVTEQLAEAYLLGKKAAPVSQTGEFSEVKATLDRLGSTAGIKLLAKPVSAATEAFSTRQEDPMFRLRKEEASAKYEALSGALQRFRQAKLQQRATSVYPDVPQRSTAAESEFPTARSRRDGSNEWDYRREAHQRHTSPSRHHRSERIEADDRDHDRKRHRSRSPRRDADDRDRQRHRSSSPRRNDRDRDRQRRRSRSPRRDDRDRDRDRLRHRSRSERRDGDDGERSSHRLRSHSRCKDVHPNFKPPSIVSHTVEVPPVTGDDAKPSHYGLRHPLGITTSKIDLPEGLHQHPTRLLGPSPDMIATRTAALSAAAARGRHTEACRPNSSATDKPPESREMKLESMRLAAMAADAQRAAKLAASESLSRAEELLSDERRRVTGGSGGSVFMASAAAAMIADGGSKLLDSVRTASGVLHKRSSRGAFSTC
jgi:hypothetical protein